MSISHMIANNLSGTARSLEMPPTIFSAVVTTTGTSSRLMNSGEVKKSFNSWESRLTNF